LPGRCGIGVGIFVGRAGGVGGICAAGGVTGFETVGAAGVSEIAGVSTADSSGDFAAAAFFGAAFLAGAFFAGFSSAGFATGGNFSRNFRTTGGSTVEDAERTNSPISWSFARTSLLSIPTSFANS
jgi:hypothetical protein